MSASDLEELAATSSFVFSGRVEDVAASNVPVVEATERTVLVRIALGLRVDPALGDVRGRLVTVATRTPDELQPGTEAVFFADSWVQGDQLAVRERAHVPAARADDVAAAVARLPDRHLKERLSDARAVVHAAVSSTSMVPGLPLERRSPRWAEATYEVVATLKGDASGLRLFFPTTESHHWFEAPSFTAGQRCVVLLHVGDPLAGNWLEGPQFAGGATALDPADSQPQDARAHIEELLQEIGA